MINATVLGRLGRDSELRNTQDGTQVLVFSVATDSGYGDKKITHWIDCSLWGKQAERLAPYMLKGVQVMLIGELSTKEFTRRDGGNGFAMTLRVDKLEFAGSKSDSAVDKNQTNQHKNNQQNQYGRYSSNRQQNNDAYSDDIPF